MIRTVEIGLRLYDPASYSLSALALVGDYNCKHLQINCTDPEVMNWAPGYLRKQLARDIELSYYTPLSAVKEPVLQIQEAINAASKHRVKFVIVPIDPVTESVSHAELKALAKHAETQRRFLCFESGTREFNETLSLAMDTREDAPFLLFSLRVDSDTDISAVKHYTRVMRTFLATIHLELDTSPSTNQMLEVLVNHLYLLPFREQPLVFTNPAGPFLEQQLNSFYHIVEEGGLEYI